MVIAWLLNFLTGRLRSWGVGEEKLLGVLSLGKLGFTLRLLFGYRLERTRERVTTVLSSGTRKDLFVDIGLNVMDRRHLMYKFFASGGQALKTLDSNFWSDVSERRSPCDLTSREWNQRVVERIERIRVLQNRRDSMSKVKWETVPLHRVGNTVEQDRWSWALDLLIVDKVVHWSVDDRTLADLTD